MFWSVSVRAGLAIFARHDRIAGMPRRRSFGQRHRRKVPGAKVVRYVGPTTRRVPHHAIPLTVPTRWVKNVIAIFLLPWCAILTQTFFTAFARATIDQRLWAGA